MEKGGSLASSNSHRSHQGIANARPRPPPTPPNQTILTSQNDSRHTYDASLTALAADPSPRPADMLRTRIDEISGKRSAGELCVLKRGLALSQRNVHGIAVVADWCSVREERR